jgi:hypothetical protein
MSNSESSQRNNAGLLASSPSTPSEIPTSEYIFRLDQRRRQLADIRILHQHLWTYLIAIVLAEIVVIYTTLLLRLIPTYWVLLPLAGSLFIIQALTKNTRSHSRVQRMVSFYQLGIARLRHQWQGRGIGGVEFRPEDHPYALDLDLFGEGSLFELLCTARTGVGRGMLAKWLLHPADYNEIVERQAAIAELCNNLDLREEWASAGAEAVDQVDSSAVRDWANSAANSFPPYARALTTILPILLIAVSIFAQFGIFGWKWMPAVVVTVLLEALLATFVLKKTRRTASDLVLPSFELALLVPLLKRLELENFQSPWLKRLQSRLTSASGRPSNQIRVLSALVWLLDLRQSEYFALPASLLLWGTNLAILIERWRQRNRAGLIQWLDSLGQFEALLCLSRYYYENRDHTFAVIRPESSSFFHAEALGHPLLDNRTCIRCDLRLEAEEARLIMVSGSNMSGKSTLLRSVGVNAILAFAGSSVRASRLEVSPLQIGCSITIQDSLVRAKSRFQAEVERLKGIIALATTGSTLFLLDEVLAGTNSNDRFFGAEAIIKQLTDNGAVGLVTTHDLSLTELVKGFDGKAMNVHFVERYENGAMLFDYKMRSGVLTRTNGLNVMAALGLLPPRACDA